MAFDIQNLRIDSHGSRSGLIFDADGVALFGRYSDELSAYRARKIWIDVLSSYFLLERSRDYEMSVTSSPNGIYHVLGCSFLSACGRYAFWRLINHQAPEAEQKLCGENNGAKGIPPIFSSLIPTFGKSATEMPLVLNGASAHGDHSRGERNRRDTLWRCLKRFF